MKQSRVSVGRMGRPGATTRPRGRDGEEGGGGNRTGDGSCNPHPFKVFLDRLQYGLQLAECREFGPEEELVGSLEGNGCEEWSRSKEDGILSTKRQSGGRF